MTEKPEQMTMSGFCQHADSTGHKWCRKVGCTCPRHTPPPTRDTVTDG